MHPFAPVVRLAIFQSLESFVSIKGQLMDGQTEGLRTRKKDAQMMSQNDIFSICANLKQKFSSTIASKFHLLDNQQVFCFTNYSVSQAGLGVTAI